MKLQPNPTLWIGMSAAELRAQGFPVDEKVPDFALLHPTRPPADDVKIDADGDLALDVAWSIGLEWRWFRADVEVTP